MVFQDRLVFVKKEVEKELAAFFVKKGQEAKKISPHCVAFVDQVKSLTLRGGKRTRAFLVWLGNEAVANGKRKTEKGKIENKVLSAMMALELFQSVALIHDDIMDEDIERRGGKTVHEAFRINALTHQRITSRNASHYGTSMAILAGDLALTWADELMKEVRSQESGVKSDDVYQRMKEEVILGQSLDVLANAGLPSADRLTINRYKTAWYSVIRPLQIGAAISGTDKKELAVFVPYGLAVGEAYQLRDDYLDRAIEKGSFERRASMLHKRALRTVTSLHVSRLASVLLTDFVRFALSRRA